MIDQRVQFSPAKTFKPGEEFNPYCILNAVNVPVSLLPYKGLGAGAKLLYGRLAMYAGKSGECFAGREKLADDLGCDVATVGRWLAELVAEGFIERVRRGPGKPAICRFLWHNALLGSLRVPLDEAVLRYQGPATNRSILNHLPESFNPLRDGAIVRDQGCKNAPSSNPSDGSEGAQLRSQSASRVSGDMGGVLWDALIQYMGDVAPRPLNGEIITLIRKAAPPGSDDESIAAFITSLRERYRPGVGSGPKDWGWFPTIVKSRFKNRPPKQPDFADLADPNCEKCFGFGWDNDIGQRCPCFALRENAAVCKTL